jgi:excisionase family DNA binding protein
MLTTESTGDLPVILTTQEACKLLRISRSVLYSEVHAGRIPVLIVGKRCWRFSRVALERWLEQEMAAA